MNQFIKSKFFTLTKEEANKSLFITNHEDTTYVKLLCANGTESIDLGGDIISKKDGVITLRIKLEDSKGQERIFKAFNRETKNNFEMTATNVLANITFKEAPKPDFNVESMIPEA